MRSASHPLDSLGRQDSFNVFWIHPDYASLNWAYLARIPMGVFETPGDGRSASGYSPR